MVKNKKTILIAEDDPAILEAVKMILEMEDYNVVTTSGDLSLIKKTLPDLVLLDIRMSGIDGRDICKELKKDEKTKNIPVIIISASREVKESAKEAGANGFLAKPFEMDELIRLVSEYLSKDQSRLL